MHRTRRSGSSIGVPSGTRDTTDAFGGLVCLAKAFNVQVRMKSLKTLVHLLQLTEIAIILLFEDGIADSMLSQCEMCRKIAVSKRKYATWSR